jgi:hypothetical protein
MVVAEVLTGIALVQKSVEFIKSNISTVNDISGIAQQIDDLFRGEKDVQQARNKKSGNSIASQFGVDTVAKEIIDAKLAAEKLQEVATMVDMRFGHGTWAGIIQERSRRIQEAKEAAMAAKLKRKREQEEMANVIKSILVVFAVCAAAVVVFLLVMVSIAKASGLLYVSDPALMH